jgi:hypothetical protein
MHTNVSIKSDDANNKDTCVVRNKIDLHPCFIANSSI